MQLLYVGEPMGWEQLTHTFSGTAPPSNYFGRKYYPRQLLFKVLMVQKIPGQHYLMVWAIQLANTYNPSPHTCSMRPNQLYHYTTASNNRPLASNNGFKELKISVSWRNLHISIQYRKVWACWIFMSIPQ